MNLMEQRKVKFGAGLEGLLAGSGELGSVVMTHGAGSGMESSLLEKTANRLAELGFKVLRFNFAYLGKRPAPSAGGKNELPELVSAVEYMKENGSEKIVLIGKSFGARVNSYVAPSLDDVRGLVFYGLPLQGISKTSKPRDWSHLGKIAAPMLFITGDKDKLCPLDELHKVQKGIESPFQSVVVPGDHSFKPKSEDAAVEACLQWMSALN